MWTPTTRKQHIRETSRYQTDVTDEEWLVIMPHLPSANSTGRPRAWPMREIINGIFQSKTQCRKQCQRARRGRRNRGNQWHDPGWVNARLNLSRSLCRWS